MSSDVLTPFDVDNDALAADLRRLADGLDDHDVLIKRVTTAHTTAVDRDPSVATLMLRYHFADEELVDQLTYVGDGDE